jgi:hypothetical protein
MAQAIRRATRAAFRLCHPDRSAARFAAHSRGIAAISPSHSAFDTDVILNEAKDLNAGQYWLDQPALPLPQKKMAH